MPCFKGIAVSIHANGAPLPEHGIQKQSRVSRINSYIPVPQPQLSTDSGRPEAAKFAISITLLTPGLAIPYSTPKATEANPYPKPQLVGELSPAEGGRFSGMVTPYIPMTNSENETIAAYIYFDGRAKEEVATLLRPGEETWVNSRWVQVPESEGGGLAEREFLFREVGLERWLNGLDLEGHDAAAKLEKRRQRFEKRRRRQAAAAAANGNGNAISNVGPSTLHRRKSSSGRDTLRYGGADAQTPLEALDDDDLDDDSLSSDDELPEATGQIKVSMFRVLASGEIKKGEYSPQFDAHDDDDESAANGGGNSVEPDVEHTTSFAKPKTLDPKTISTQTVTGIDGPDKPYATFTFFYRGERQLQKMGIVQSVKATQSTPNNLKRRSAQLDFSNIGPLKTAGTVGFSAFRDHDTEAARRKKSHKKNNGSISGAMDEDSDDDDDDDDDDDHNRILGKMDDVDDKDDKDSKAAKTDKMGPEEAKFSGELADGVNRIRLKRQHSAENAGGLAGAFRKSPSSGPFGGDLTPPASGTPPLGPGVLSTPGPTSLGGASASSTTGIGIGANASTPGTSSLFGKSLADESIVGSPLKKHRASLAEGPDGELRAAFPPALGDILAKAEAAQKQQQSAAIAASNATVTTALLKEDEDEEL